MKVFFMKGIFDGIFLIFFWLEGNVNVEIVDKKI